MEPNGHVRILVEKRRYKPSGWTHLRDFTVPARITAKRIYPLEKIKGHVFSKETSQEITNIDNRIWQSIRYSVDSWMEVM